MRNYYTVRDELRSNPKTSIGKLDSVATSTELTSQRNLITRERRDHLRQSGSTTIAELRVQSVNLDNSDPEAGKVPIVEVDVCYDVSAADLLDAEGKSVVSPKRADTGWVRHTVANYQWSSEPTDAWRIASSQDIEGSPCDGS